ncbi:MAG TPA: hypothetical protein VM537_09095 [Anaerolineae bacterium]|nr:hypothetical protein [Anaerolineae bacterium]
MNYDQFRTLFHEALDAAGLMPALPQSLEAVSLGRMRRTYETIVELGAPQPRPFYVTATLSWEWDAALAARSATTEEGLLTELLGRDGYSLVTERPWLRVGVRLTASLPTDAPIPMPEAGAWRRWAAKVQARLAPLLPIQSEDDEYGLRVLSARSEPEARLRCDPDTGRLYLTRVELSAWQGIDLPRQWDNPDREPDPWPEPQLADLAGRVRSALQAWEKCLRYLRMPVND